MHEDTEERPRSRNQFVALRDAKYAEIPKNLERDFVAVTIFSNTKYIRR
jgi:hypothetical protein